MKRARRRYRVHDANSFGQPDSYGWAMDGFGQLDWRWYNGLIVEGLGMGSKLGCGLWYGSGGSNLNRRGFYTE